MRDLVSQITELAKRGTTYSIYGGRERRLTDTPLIRDDMKYRLWEQSTPSFVGDLPTHASSPQMGAQVVAHRTGVIKEGVLDDRYTVGVITAADINVGVIHNETSRHRMLVGAQTIVRATVQPPAVYFRNGSDSPLAEVEPGTSMWEAAQVFVDMVEVNAAALGGSPQQITHIPVAP